MTFRERRVPPVAALVVLVTLVAVWALVRMLLPPGRGTYTYLYQDRFALTVITLTSQDGTSYEGQVVLAVSATGESTADVVVDDYEASGTRDGDDLALVVQDPGGTEMQFAGTVLDDGLSLGGLTSSAEDVTVYRAVDADEAEAALAEFAGTTGTSTTS